MNASSFMESSLCEYIDDLQKKSNKSFGTTAKIIQGRIADARKMFNTLAGHEEHNVPYHQDVQCN